MPPAARLTDMHVCPMVTPGLPPIPHVGGPITGPGVPNVLIGGLPAAVLGDMCTCVGPPDAIIKGSATVMISGRPAAISDRTHDRQMVRVLRRHGEMLAELNAGRRGFDWIECSTILGRSIRLHVPGVDV